MTIDSIAQLARKMNIAANADQAEAYCMSLEDARCAIDDSTADEVIAGEFDDADAAEPVGIGADGMSLFDHAQETLVGETINCIEQRAKLLGDAYPFTLEAGTLTYSSSNTGVYEFCLETSRISHAAGNGRAHEVVFEYLAANLAAQWLGQGNFMRTGWPPVFDGLRPTRFKKVSEILTQLTGEWHWNPSAYEEHDPDPAHCKDEGLDFVVWNSLDVRPGSLFLIGQCACGTNWSSKLDELQVSRLRRWWQQMTFIDPVRAFAIPYAIYANESLSTISGKAGLVFDRIRLSHIAESAPIDKRIVPTRLQELIACASVRPEAA